VTVASSTRNWQKRPVGKPGPPEGPPAAASLFPIRDHLVERWGGQYLSVHDMWHDRPIVGGSVPSSHRGAAFDWRYMAPDGTTGPGPGRPVLLREVLPFLIDHSVELNIQQIHDYVGSAIWKAERARDRNGGWKTQPRGSQMGQPWAGWIHIEAGEWGWSDGRPVAERLGLVAPSPNGADHPAPAVVTDVVNAVWGLWPLGDKPELQIGSMGDPVLYLQSVIFHRCGGGIARDSSFGSQTRRRVRDVQGAHGLRVDGKCGPRTWAVIDRLAAG
jgi:hypothetical protein